MKTEIKYLITAVIFSFFGIIGLMVPPTSDPTGIMQVDQFFEAFHPGQYITIPLFIYFGMLYFVKAYSHWKLAKDIEAMRAKKSAAFLK